LDGSLLGNLCDRSGEPDDVPPELPRTDGNKLQSGVRRLLEALIGRIGQSQIPTPTDESIKAFYMEVAPKISISAYIARLHLHIPSDSSFIFALAYIQRLSHNVVVSELTWVRLLITGITVARKFIDDEEDIHYNNAFYAKVGGLSLKMLDELEICFLKLLDWRLFITEAEYRVYHKLIYESACR
jgi:hypothetical protein